MMTKHLPLILGSRGHHQGGNTVGFPLRFTLGKDGISVPKPYKHSFLIQLRVQTYFFPWKRNPTFQHSARVAMMTAFLCTDFQHCLGKTLASPRRALLQWHSHTPPKQAKGTGFSAVLHLLIKLLKRYSTSPALRTYI